MGLVPPYGVSWRVSGIFRIIIVKPLIWKYTERNPLVGGSAWWLPAEGLCYLAPQWNNSGSTRGGWEWPPTPTPPQPAMSPAPAPNGKRFEIPAWLQWRVTGMGVAGGRKYRLETFIKKERKKNKQAIFWAFHENFILELSHCKWDEKEGSSKENNHRNGTGGPRSLRLLP